MGIESNLLSFNSDRRFGVELEVLAFDGLNRPANGNKPAGIDHVAMIVARSTSESCEIRGYEHTNSNDVWVVKPDSSCGMEVCTPIYKGWSGLKRCCEVVAAFGSEPLIQVDNRCSVHVHVEISDLNQEQIAKVVSYWIKCEPVFIDAMPPSRKRNRYCQFMGFNNIVQHDMRLSPKDLMSKVGSTKYYSLNLNQYVQNNRKTIEFRIAEANAVKDAFTVKQWVRLIIHFIERAIRSPDIANYREGDPWSGYCWLDPEDVFKFLGFSDNPKQYDLSLGLKQTRDWFLARLDKFIDKTEGFRQFAKKEIDCMLSRRIAAGDPILPEKHLSPVDLKSYVFDEDTKN